MTLSVITICFNNLSDLQATCRSVDSQGTLPDEHLIIDGSSNKDILTWLSTNAQPSYRRWIHERDNGISDAFNKGIREATGELTHLLNSGDEYASVNAIGTVTKQFKLNPDLQWTHSRYIQHRGGMDVVTGHRFEKDKLWKGMRTVAHPTMFIRKGVYAQHGVYDDNLKIAMDFDLLLRIRDEKFHFIPLALVYFAPGGASNVQFGKGLREVRLSYKKYFRNSLPLIGWQIRQRLLRFAMSTTMGRSLFRLKNKSD